MFIGQSPSLTVINFKNFFIIVIVR